MTEERDFDCCSPARPASPLPEGGADGRAQRLADDLYGALMDPDCEMGSPEAIARYVREWSGWAPIVAVPEAGSRDADRCHKCDTFRRDHTVASTGYMFAAAVPEAGEGKWAPQQGWRVYTDALLSRLDRVQVLAARWEQSGQHDAQKAGRILTDVLLSGHDCDGGQFDRTTCPDPCGAMHSYCSTCGARVDECPNDTASQNGDGSGLPTSQTPGDPADPENWCEACQETDIDYDPVGCGCSCHPAPVVGEREATC